MKLHFVLGFLLASSSVHHSNVAAEDDSDTIFRPYRISLSELTSGNEESYKSLSNVLEEVGIVAVKNVPGYADQRSTTLSSLHQCIKGGSSAALSHTFADGTVRSTLATHTVPGPGGMQKMFKEGTPEECADFEKASGDLRETVSHVTETFANTLGTIFDTGDSPLLVTGDGAYSFDKVGDVASNGEHLEHFHCYEHKHDSRKSHEETVEIHTDHGLFLAFTPGVMIDNNDESYSEEGGFYIEKKDGTRLLVEFEPNDLIIMLGDGVNQYVNPHVVGSKLRATPHALIMPKNINGASARVWHGRLILPPSGAVHPTHGKTFGDLRRLMIDESIASESKQHYNSLMCSSPSATARILEETTCEEGTIYCWSRCMDANTTEASPAECGRRNLQLQCINPRGQVYEQGHGDYYPACSNSTEPATPFPDLPPENYFPRDEEVCTDEAFQEYASAEGYDNSFDFSTAKFMWSVADGKVNGRLVYHNLFGWLAWGFAGPPGSNKNGMHNASIIMALPGGDYNPADGLDLSLDDTINDYKVHHTMNYFRFWDQPIPGGDLSSYAVEATECFTSLSFNTDSIGGISFNLDGKDELIWGGNGWDYHLGYHRDNRYRFSIDWPTGKLALLHEDEHEEEDGENESSSANGMTWALSFMMAAVLQFLV